MAAERQARDPGTASLELVFVAPMLLAVLMMIIAFGRFAQTESLVDQAARDGARAATAQNAKAAVGPLVQEIAEQTTERTPESCSGSASARSSMTAGAYGLPDLADPTRVESVTVQVSCTLDLSDLFALPLRSVVVKRTFTSPLDRYRGYQ